jgi:glycosyltransferase involved in cell wall biosynthesis
MISVIVPVRDAAATLSATLAGLGAQLPEPPGEVIVVDDGSRDGSAELAQRSPIVSRVVSLNGGGPGRARNAGVAAATGDQLAFIDADCRPSAGWLRAGRAALARADLVLGETRPRPDQPWGSFDRTLSVVGCSPLFEAANLFVRRDLFERLGGFESWLGPRDGKELGEDVWFGWRARRAGARIVAVPEALVHHAVFARGPLAFAAERWRLRFFPALARRVPELRSEMFFAHLFLSERSARFDAALFSLLVATKARRVRYAAGALPYALTLSRDLREPDGRRRAVGRAAADTVGCAALALGSVRYRSPLL